MLVLARKMNESIVIAGKIRISVIGIEGRRVRIGIEAPKSIPVRREEIAPTVRQEPVSSAA
jgi:carbon storage regulator